MMYCERRPCTGLFVGVSLLMSVTVRGAGDIREPFGPHEQHHLDAALHCMNMTRDDLAFSRDHGKPDWTLPGIKELLAQPLNLPPLAARFRTAASGDLTHLWSLAGALLEAPGAVPPFDGPGDVWPLSGDELDPMLTECLGRFVAAAAMADKQLKRAYRTILPDERAYAAAYGLGAVLDLEDDEGIRAGLIASGISSGMVDRVIREATALDPEPAATEFLDIMRRVDMAAMLEAGARLDAAVERLRRDAEGVSSWPSKPVRLSTPHGPIFIGTEEVDRYTEAALLILDPGGDDAYGRDAGVAHGLAGQKLSAVVDLLGADRYDGGPVLSAGSALFGISVLTDAQGDDLYRAVECGQGTALFGCALVRDEAGADTYRAHALSQGAGTVGFGMLRDEGGDDLYDVGIIGQGYAGVNGVGLLVDVRGNDRYLAGGTERDHGRHDDRFLSLAQGMSMGMRPFAGGGYGVLIDFAGNDSYEADIFGQGVGYWYAVGMLLDGAGNDTYGLYQYGQGAGIHLSLGYLEDEDGSDQYGGYVLTQGCAHDYAVGMLVERAGDDTYTADHHSQGRGMNNGLALLLDRQGNDAYFARQPELCQGIGNAGGRREYGSLAVLMDLAGRDHYTCGAGDGARLLRPDFGIVYDVED